MQPTINPSAGEVHWSSRLRPRLVDPASRHGKDGDNQRWAGRKRTDIPGYVYCEKLATSPRCVVRDMSSSGALIYLQPSAERLTADDMPECFTLAMLHFREQTEVQCVIVRRLGNAVGVRFTGAFKSKAMPARPQMRADARR